MPDFRTLYESKKWNEISGMEKAALTRMSTGNATVDDVRAIQHLISQYQNLVSSTFRSGLRALSVTAEQRVQRVAEHRAELGKDPLSEEQFNRLLGLALDKAWFEQGPELAVLLESELEKSRSAQTKDFESLLDAKFEFYRPRKEPEERVQEVSNELNEAWGADEEPSLLERSLSKQDEDMSEDSDLNVPLSAKLIEQANESSNVTQDLADELADLTNPDKQEDREDSKIKKWWRAFKDKMPSVKGKARGIMAGLAILLGRLLVTELMGGKLWSHIQEFFAWDHIKKMGSEFTDMASGLMEKGWKTVSEYLSFEKINKLFKDALAWGLDSLGSMGTAIKNFFGFGTDEETPPDARVPGPGAVGQSLSPEAQKQLDELPKYDSAVPQIGADGTVDPTIAEKRQAIIGGSGASGTWSDDAPPTSQANVPGPGQESADKQVAPPGPTTDDPNPAAESSLKDDPLAAKGSGTAAAADTKPESKEMTLGDQKQNEVADESKAAPAQAGVSQSPGKAVGGVQSSMAGFSRGVSVDGTLTVMNFGMLTN